MLSFVVSLPGAPAARAQGAYPRLNCAYGGWPPERAAQFLAFASRAFDGPIDLAPYRG